MCLQLTKERDRLQAMMHHLNLKHAASAAVTPSPSSSGSASSVKPEQTDNSNNSAHLAGSQVTQVQWGPGITRPSQAHQQQLSPFFPSLSLPLPQNVTLSSHATQSLPLLLPSLRSPPASHVTADAAVNQESIGVANGGGAIRRRAHDKPALATSGEAC